MLDDVPKSRAVLEDLAEEGLPDLSRRFVEGIDAHRSFRHKEKVPQCREVEYGRCTKSPFRQWKNWLKKRSIQTGLPQLN